MKRITLRLEDDILDAAEGLISSGKSGTITHALKSLIREGMDMSCFAEELDKNIKFQIQTLALLQRFVGMTADETLITLSKSDAKKIYQDIRSR